MWSYAKVPTAGILDGYRPLASAAKAHFADSTRVAVSGGWRAGKSFTSAMEALAWLPFANLIWLVALDYDMSRQEFQYLAEAAVSCGLVAPEDVRFSLNKYSPCSLQTIDGGCVVEQRTLADFRKLAAKPPDLVIVCEPGLIDNLEQVMELLFGRVAEKRGCIWLAGTSDQASEEWFQVWSRWSDPDNIEGGRSFSIPTWENTYRFPQGEEEPTLRLYRLQYGEEAYQAHFGGVPSKPKDLVVGDLWDPRLHINPDLAFKPELPVALGIDPNYSLGHRYSIEVIQWNDLGGRYFLVDEIAVEGQVHDQVIREAMSRPWWKYVQYAVIDPYAGESEIFGGYAPVYYWRPHLDLRMDFRPKVKSTVQSLREVLGKTPGGSPILEVAGHVERFPWEMTHWKLMKNGRPSTENCDATKAAGYWFFDHLTRKKALRHYDENDSNVPAGYAQDWDFDP